MLRQTTQKITALYPRLSHEDELQGESNSISNHDVIYKGWFTPSVTSWLRLICGEWKTVMIRTLDIVLLTCYDENRTWWQQKENRAWTIAILAPLTQRKMQARNEFYRAVEFPFHTELQLKSLKKILIAWRAWSSYETCFVISFLINHKTGSAVRRCLPD